MTMRSPYFALLGIAVVIFLESCCCATPKHKPTVTSISEADSGLVRSDLSLGTRPVWVTKSSGPAVLLLHELPGMTPGAIALANRLSREQEAYRVYLPLMFGKFGESSPFNFLRLYHRDWKSYRTKASAPISSDVASLCEDISKECPGNGLVVVGNCLSGALAVEMLRLPEVTAVVASQPATPYRLFASAKTRSSLGITPEYLEQAKLRSTSDTNPRVLSFRFSKDKLSPRERFLTLASEFGAKFDGYVLSTEPKFEGSHYANINRIVVGECDDRHSVLTKAVDPADNPGQEEATRVLLEFLREVVPRQ